MAATQLTGQSVVVFALQQIGAYGIGETLQASDATIGLSRLNAMISSWSLQPQTMVTIGRGVFDIVANQAAYTIGPGGGWNTVRPTTIQYATLLLNSASPPVEIPLQLLTDQQYEGIAVKSQTNTLPTALFYNATYLVGGLGQIALWPVPTSAANDIVLYTQSEIAEFPDLTTAVYVPPGYEEAFGYNLALRLAPIYARPVPDDVRTLAKQSLATIKRGNTKMTDLFNDAAFIGMGRAYPYNILTDI